MLFLPRNTCIKDLIARLTPYKDKLIGGKRKNQIELTPGANLSTHGNYAETSELSLEIE